MYGVVLMVAMAGGAETPALFHKGCSGYSCSGYSCSGYSCSGYSCSGYSCSGYSSCHGCRGGHKLFGHKSKGCHGGCSGYVSCYGSSCYGSGYAPSCYGSGYAPVGGGCYGSSAVVVPGAIGGGCYGAPMVAPQGVIQPGVVHPEHKAAPPVKGKDAEKLKKPPVDNDETAEAAPARITITVPSDARVSIDGTMTVSTQTTRVFESPTLLPGKSYTYTFQAEFVRDGQNVVVTREVQVKAGSDVSVSLENATAVASR